MRTVRAKGRNVNSPSFAQTPDSGAVPVTVENFIRAESDLYLRVAALKEGGLGKFKHHRELSPIDAQTIIRMNRDTPFIQPPFSISMPGRSRSRCPTRASGPSR
jgi:hypothetical protein